MFRVRAAATGDFEENEPWMVVSYSWPDVKYGMTEKEDGFTIVTDDLIVEGNIEPFKIKVFNKENKLLHADADDAQSNIKKSKEYQVFKVPLPFK